MSVINIEFWCFECDDEAHYQIDIYNQYNEWQDTVFLCPKCYYTDAGGWTSKEHVSVLNLTEEIKKLYATGTETGDG